MQLLGVINDRTVQHGLDRLADIGNVGDDGPDSQGLQVLVGSTPHAAGQQDITVPDIFEHLLVLAPGVVAKTAALAVSVALPSNGLFPGKLAMAGLGQHFPALDLPVLDLEYQVLFCTPEVRAHGEFIHARNRYFHFCKPQDFDDLNYVLHFLYQKAVELEVVEE